MVLEGNLPRNGGIIGRKKLILKPLLNPSKRKGLEHNLSQPKLPNKVIEMTPKSYQKFARF